MIAVKICQNEKEWEDFVTRSAHAPFTQSYTWASFQNKLGNKFWRLGLYKNNALVGVALVVKEHTKLGSYLNCPDGPVMEFTKINISIFNQFLIGLAKNEGCGFIRLDPRIENSPKNRDLFENVGYRNSSGLLEVLFGWVLSLEISEEELLSQMRKTTRYEIRQKEKEGIDVWSSKKLDDVEIFHKLLDETAKRKGFKAFPKEYLKTQFELFSKKNQVELFFARSKGKIRAAAYVMFYGDTATYLHGASISEKNNSSVSYALQWEIIKAAKKKGHKMYDFWGVVEKDDPKHPWYGISLFKKGFGGYILPYLLSQDLPIGYKYYWIRAVEILRKLMQ